MEYQKIRKKGKKKKKNLRASEQVYPWIMGLFGGSIGSIDRDTLFRANIDLGGLLHDASTCLDAWVKGDESWRQKDFHSGDLGAASFHVVT